MNSISNEPVTASQAAPEKEDTEVIAFRLRHSQVSSLSDMVVAKRVVGVHSTDQFARWIVEQFLSGRLSFQEEFLKS